MVGKTPDSGLRRNDGILSVERALHAHRLFPRFSPPPLSRSIALMTRPTAKQPLAGAVVAITRPAGTGGALARRVRTLGGVPLRLPGLGLRAAEDAEAARRALRAALRAEVVVFTSPAAVRHAARLVPLRFARATAVIGIGAGTARALRRAGVARALHPAGRQDSAGALALPGLEDVRGQRVALIGAPGGRGVLDAELARRGATLLQAHVYRRVPPRLTRRHLQALAAVRGPLYVLLSSAEALTQLRAALPLPAWSHLAGGTAVVSSARLATAARRAGFAAIAPARSALAADLLAAAVAAHAR